MCGQSVCPVCNTPLRHLSTYVIHSIYTDTVYALKEYECDGCSQPTLEYDFCNQEPYQEHDWQITAKAQRRYKNGYIYGYRETHQPVSLTPKVDDIPF